MPDYLAWIIGGVAFLGLFVFLYILIVKRQADDPNKRDADSEPPPGGVY
jgi:hypothetical protein